VVEMGLIQPLKPCRIEASSYTLISSGNSFKKWEHRKWECPILSIPIEAVESTSRIEVLVKAEHDFYREKWQKEQKKKMRFHLTCDKMRHILRGWAITTFEWVLPRVRGAIFFLYPTHHNPRRWLGDCDWDVDHAYGYRYVPQLSNL